tara:strand:- start:254 stop:526 length:273 start_codon:yes stop_codon:yes gene_type:complete
MALSKEYEYEDKVYLCIWNDNIVGLYTYDELKKEYGDTNLFDEPLHIPFYSFNEPRELGTFQEVIDFLDDDTQIFSRLFVSHNMRIGRVK